MSWLKNDLWKVGIALLGLLCLMVIPMAVASAKKPSVFVSSLAIVQATPTEDATVAALSKEQLTQQVAGQQHTLDNWLWSNIATILTSLISTLALAATGVFAVIRYFNDRKDMREKQVAEAKRRLGDRQAERNRRGEEQQRWLKDREDEREKRAEERFQMVVEGLSSEREDAKVGAAITLRTFLRSDYKQFYIQAFDLAVAHLRLPRSTSQLAGEEIAEEDRAEIYDPLNIPLPLTTLSQALITVFKEAFPLARMQNKGDIRALDASYVQLDRAILNYADLEQAWMVRASLREAQLFQARLGGTNLARAYLYKADLREATLQKTNLRRAFLQEADLRGANLEEAQLPKADLLGANLEGAKLQKANLEGAKLQKADLSKATLTSANLKGANLQWVKLNDTDLSGADLTGAHFWRANPEKASSLVGTNLQNVEGLSKEQQAMCKKQGAIINEESVTSPSPSPTSSVSPTHGEEQRTSSPQEHLPAASPSGDKAEEP